MCETDYSGYPGCRYDTIMAMQFAHDLGGNPVVALIVEQTHSCYRAACPACHLRASGWNRWRDSVTTTPTEPERT